MAPRCYDDRFLESFRDKGVLITGASGYLASGLIALLKNAPCRIVRLARPGSRLEPESGAAQFEDLRGDLREAGIWEQGLAGIDFVFHLAAQTSSYAADADPVADQAANVLPMLQLLEACRRLGSTPAVCFASTVTVAGIPDRLPVDESHPDHPLTVYDLHKQMAEQYLRFYSRQGVVRGVSLRLANVYGPGPGSSRADRGILNQMMRRAVAGEPLTIYGQGDHLRDYVYVEDVARAFIAAALHAGALDGGHFVIGSGEGHTIAAAMELIAGRSTARTGREVAVRHVEPPGTLSPIEQRDFIADSRRFSEATGWTARTTLAEGIDLTLETLL